MAFDFELILAAAFIITGIAWGIDRVVYHPKRKQLLVEMDPEAVANLDSNAKLRLADTPKVLLEVKSYFVIVAVIFGLRSFVIEPFQIPSGSMLPTLKIGDFILVNKFEYGVRLPVLNTTIIPTNEPKRGDVVVFKYPVDPSLNFIKRLVGLPGDKISYHNKRLMINGKLVDQSLLEELPYSFNPNKEPVKLFDENLDGVNHATYNSYRWDKRLEGDWVVPEGHYFMMGDNRDNSSDSRVWGFVPEENLKGRAFYVWMHWSSWFSIPSFKNNGLIK
ncbi:signal peptidase I [Marinomonas mediterranea]|jgi:signal peptidase I (EC:3.4.21.89). Serine peptidase. MEROPS family S26A|uniref:Signal peptidase I n=1 Tax=Marinomonas mediterranea (strain ATCC 700492 / JCM 21426 / NBRC 103028 / MMB-1) TaxID=717774 RepID=F2JTW7_MARM1|nr:signal peptidase I [Marinomonas mediterranea]ADZ90388.1 signal peptidase I [Marinomonas mediterranea MMB-1]WCN16570.1 signal peptidase I [Marinomonas mediterranea MMB-1]